MARYPVTYARFQAFIDAEDGFRNACWWSGLRAGNGHKASPGEQAFKFWNHPREHVSWYDAVAFCRWLSQKLGAEVRLPTEHEWERAARHTDGREYPWGHKYYEGFANINESYGDKGRHYLETTVAVGVYPQCQPSRRARPQWQRLGMVSE